MSSQSFECEELHKKSWSLVGTYLKANLRTFTGRAKDAESTILPALSSYIDEAFSEIPEVRSMEDHAVFIWGNLPACGVMSVHTYEWCITAVSNILAIYRRNGIAILVHPNRGSQPERTAQVLILHCCALLTSVKMRKPQPCRHRTGNVKDEVKGEDEDVDMDEVKKDESDEESAEGPPDLPINQEEADIREMKYKLEPLCPVLLRNFSLSSVSLSQAACIAEEGPFSAGAWAGGPTDHLCLCEGP